MTQDELCALLRLHGMSIRTRSDEVLVEVCPHCGNSRWNLELNARLGIFNCWACPYSGTLSTLLHRLTGEKYDVPVNLETSPGTPGIRTLSHPNTPENKSVEDAPLALRWLRDRGISRQDVHTYNLRLCTERGHRLFGRIMYPQQEFFTNELFGYGGRSYIKGIRPKYLTTAETRTIGGLKHRRHSPVVLVEGYFDGLAVHRVGYTAAILFGSGSREVEVLGRRLPPKLPLILALDGSAWEQANRWYWTLKPLHTETRIIRLPEMEDPGSMSSKDLENMLRTVVAHS